MSRLGVPLIHSPVSISQLELLSVGIPLYPPVNGLRAARMTQSAGEAQRWPAPRFYPPCWTFYGAFTGPVYRRDDHQHVIAPGSSVYDAAVRGLARLHAQCCNRAIAAGLHGNCPAVSAEQREGGLNCRW
jgi:hypothetical protein